MCLSTTILDTNTQTNYQPNDKWSDCMAYLTLVQSSYAKCQLFRDVKRQFHAPQ